MKALSRSLLSLALTLGAASLPTAARAYSVTKWTAGSTGTVPNPVIVNLFWDSSFAQWDADVAKVGSAATVDRITMMTKSIMNSQYFTGGDSFQGLTQYGINAPTGVFSLVTGSCPSLPTTPSDTAAGHNLMPQVVSCVGPILQARGVDLSQVILNVLYPPQVPGGGDENLCTVNAAYHDDPSGLGAATYDPLSCNHNSLNQLMGSITHEIVESVTNQNSFGYFERDATTGWYGIEIGDLCEGPPGGPSGFVRFDSFLDTVMGQGQGGEVSNYWSDAISNCVPNGNFGGAPAPYRTTFPDGGQGNLGLQLCGRGVNMEMTLTYYQYSPALPWDLPSNGQGQQSLYLSANIQSPAGVSPARNSNIGEPLRAPVGDTIGFGSIDFNKQYCLSYSPDTCAMITEAHGFNQEVPMAAGDIVKVTVTDPSNGQDLTLTQPVPAAANVTLNVVAPSGSPNGWTFFGDATQLQGQVQDSCTLWNVPLHQSGGPGPIEGEPVTGTVGAFGTLRSFSAGSSGPTGGYQTQLVSPSAGIQTITVVAGPATNSMNFFPVHPVVTSINPGGGLFQGGETVTVTGAGFVPGSRTSVSMVNVGTSAVTCVSSVNVAPDGKSLTFTAPTLPGDPFQVIVNVDGVPSLPLAFNVCEPITSCTQAMACNTTLNDGCETVQCGACAGGATCNINHNCCPAHMQPDGTGGCVCGPAVKCPLGLSWDPVDCRCYRCSGTSCM